ncbi:glycosyltransferase family 4 protein [uncultured Maribacter sp.]|uniref:glycosyltransferase family 4 protein n=1 Tax=uncultured Maribacter sp. TaxID=431308 RepID=UPI002606A561|nr:glycosyltransferase family 4 protein [uncultured Maribacter sp.]
MKVHFITENEYPNISASANRLSLLIRALKHENTEVDVISIGYFKKMPFKIDLFISFILKFIATFTIIFKVNKTDIVFFYGAFRMPWIAFLLKLKGVKMITERTEYPHYLILQSKNFLSVIKSKLAILSMSFSDSFITCSKNLANFYSEKTKIKNFLILPLILDDDTIDGYENGFSKEITYCGYMGNNKDGVFDLITSFKKVNNLFPEWKLKLIGHAEEEVMNDLKEMVYENNLSNNVDFTGKLPHVKVLKLLRKSSILALARPDNLQSQGGFPSKLGEYLSTRLPVVVTRVGEIPNYIEDGINGFLANPNDPNDFAEKLIFVINNYEQAKKIGISGKKIAENFDYKIQGKRIFDFIKK